MKALFILCDFSARRHTAPRGSLFHKYKCGRGTWKPGRATGVFFGTLHGKNRPLAVASRAMHDGSTVGVDAVLRASISWWGNRLPPVRCAGRHTNAEPAIDRPNLHTAEGQATFTKRALQCQTSAGF